MGPFDNVNTIIRKWGEDKLKEAKAKGRSLGIRHVSGSPSESDSLDGMTVKFKKRAGDIISVLVFTFRRHLHYVRNGAGRGYGGNKGSTWQNKDGERKRTNTASLGKAGTGVRTAKPFLDPVDTGVQMLLDDVAEASMDAVFNNAFNNR